MSDPKGVKTVFYAATVSQMAEVQLRLLVTCEETDSARRAVAARRQRDGETPEEITDSVRHTVRQEYSNEMDMDWPCHIAAS